jgi:hypothetical protein
MSVSASVTAARNPNTVVRIKEHRPAMPLLKGRTYREARNLLLKEGWVPRRNPASQGDSAGVQLGNGPAFWDEGYHELSTCSATGFDLCRFEYNDAQGDHTLVVITAGAEDPEEDAVALVDRVFLDKRLVQTSAGK